MSASTTNLPSNPAGVAARLSTNGAFWLGRSGLLLGSGLLGDRGDCLAWAGGGVGHWQETVGGVEYKYTGWGGGTVTDGRGVVGGCWENRGPTHLCTLGAASPSWDFPVVDCFIFLYLCSYLGPRAPCARVCILWSPYTAPASRNRWGMSARQLSESAALTRATPILPLLAELVRRSCAGGGAPLWAGCVRSSAVRRQREAGRRQPLENGRERPQTLWASGARRARGDGRGRPRVCPVLWSQGFPIKATAAEIGSVPICFSGTRLCRPRPCSRLTCRPDAARRRGQRVCCSRASCSASAAQACLAALHRPYPATWRPPYVPSASFLPPRTKLLSQQAPAANSRPGRRTPAFVGRQDPALLPSRQTSPSRNGQIAYGTHTLSHAVHASNGPIAFSLTLNSLHRRTDPLLAHGAYLILRPPSDPSLARARSINTSNSDPLTDLHPSPPLHPLPRPPIPGAPP